MIKVTETAVGKIKTLLDQDGHPEFGLRMKVVGGGCSGLQYQMEFEESPGEDDSTIETQGVKLFVDMKSALYLAGSELDFDDGLMGSGLSYRVAHGPQTLW